LGERSQGQRHRADGANVGGDIIAGPTVAARHCSHKFAVFIAKTDGHAVDLGFADKLHTGAEEIAAGAEPFGHAVAPGPKVRLVIGIVDRHHRHGVLDGVEPLDGLGHQRAGSGCRA
jgi:hypothetical protein